MTKQIKYAAFAALGLFAGSLVPMHHASAQSTVSQSDEEITVAAPRIVHRQIAGMPPADVRIDDVSLTRRVSYAGLNLNNPADRGELERRIRYTVKEACRELDNLYPDYPPGISSDSDCRTQALRDSMAQVRALASSE